MDDRALAQVRFQSMTRKAEQADDHLRRARFTKVTVALCVAAACLPLLSGKAAASRRHRANSEAPTITASSVAFPSGHNDGTAVITWNGGKDHPYAEVWVKVGGRDEEKVIEQGSGSRQVKVKAGQTYLYMLEDAGQLLSSVTVAAASNPATSGSTPEGASPSADRAGQDQKLSLSAAGRSLRDFYSSMNVENLWLAEHHVNWETGEPDMPEAEHGNKTHCSAFIAAACKRKGIYILRPPEHGQLLLANAQADWLESGAGGWRKLPDNEDLFSKAQQLANDGKVVVAIYKNPDPTKPGHAGLVMPAERFPAQLADEGPAIIMAGTHNYNLISLKKGFRTHISQWPEHSIEFFAHNS